ncbi:hypothetical protein E2C01_031750 [Portunus trituberculatus]|uniref:Uncharacterized protein n=1 Tax=Portunus trituberculatus TaxID=210409 RepID=A0A5B7EXR7_PORTR|nr:hypothetical protein [Portunus trituberculatus]
MVLSVTSSTGSPGEYKSSDDSMQNVSDSSELLYKYQLETKELVDVLRHDMDKLKSVRQVCAGVACDGGWMGTGWCVVLVWYGVLFMVFGAGMQQPAPRKKRSSSYFSKMAMLHEEDAPMPPSEVWCCHRQHAPETSSSSS